MIRRRAGLVWLVTVAATWLPTTTLFVTTTRLPACVVLAGPATATALRVRRYHRFGPAALAGLAVAAGILIFIWTFTAASGAALRGT